MRFSSIVASGALAAGASAANNYLGFNSGATLVDRSPKVKSDFEAEFKTAQALKGAPGKFNAVRLYTNIQAGSDGEPIEAFEAAIDTHTYILLGMWASQTDSIQPEIDALKKAVSKYGKKFTDLVIGISIGSEDLYRDSVTGRKNKAGVGNSPDNILGFIKDFKKAFSGNDLGKTPVGHVDTWDVWTNSTIKPIIDAVDWIGVDEYPFYESGKGNDIKNAGALFDRAYEATIGAAGGKPVWVTETGWAVTGPDWDEAKPSVDNAKKYWQDVGCRKLFNKTPTFWYNLRDSNPENKVKFAISKDLSSTPLFDLSCPKHSSDDDDNSSSGSQTKTSDKGSSTSMSKPSATSGDSSSESSGSGSASKTSGSGAATTSSASTTSGSSTGSGSGSDSGSGSGSGSDSGSGSSSGSGSGSASGTAPAASETGDQGSAATLLQAPATALVAVAIGVLALF